MESIDEDIRAMKALDLCLKCNKGGKLLICSANDCPIVVHKECLEFPSFDEMGNFYCPYCVYKRDYEECAKARRKAVMKEKELSIFMDKMLAAGIGNEECVEMPNIVRNIDVQLEKDQPDQVAEVHNKVAAPAPQVSVELINKEAEVYLENNNSDTSHDRGQKHDDNNEKVVGNENESEPIVSRTGDECKLDRDRLHGGDKTAGEDNPNETFDEHHEEAEQLNAPTKSSKVVKSSKNLKSPIPSKRKRLLWTVEEEEMLKEGVQEFSKKVRKNLPWQKILEYGRSIFDETRSPVDLKDKWKNMASKEPDILIS